ncbi:hypothetical protein [Francisella sp. SYW-9]|uniref:hypothetical protein n=1 Tax=Francisella sp. SYW-9 TaxID=2610888 RepID=UPI00123C9D91|nr:hypothetical protein [Francisella sp. SYW-9]
MKIIKFDDCMVSKDKTPVIKDLAANFIRLNILSDESVVDLSDAQKKLFEQILNHLVDDEELQLTMSDIENFEKAEEALRPNFKSNESLIMFYLYLLCRCSFESASNEVLKVWKDILANFELGKYLNNKPVVGACR